NGTWEFTTDTYDQGLRRRWYDGRSFSRRICVPFAYQTPLSGINVKEIHQAAWYARSFAVPAAWAGRDILFHFGAVDYRTTVWLNGDEVGHNEGGHVPFSFNITPFLRTGENRITVRADDPQDGYQPRGKQSISGQPKGCDYYCTTGIWQTVWLEPVPAFRIEALRVSPQLAEDDALHVRVLLHAPAIGWELEAEALEGDQVVASVARVTAGASANLRLRISDPKPWSPEAPHLYDLRIRLLQGGQVVDEVASYTGLRRIELRGGRVHLNGEPIPLVMVLD